LQKKVTNLVSEVSFYWLAPSQWNGTFFVSQHPASGTF